MKKGDIIYLTIPSRAGECRLIVDDSGDDGYVRLDDGTVTRNIEDIQIQCKTVKRLNKALQRPCTVADLWRIIAEDAHIDLVEMWENQNERSKESARRFKEHCESSISKLKAELKQKQDTITQIQNILYNERGN